MSPYFSIINGQWLDGLIFPNEVFIPGFKGLSEFFLKKNTAKPGNLFYGLTTNDRKPIIHKAKPCIMNSFTNRFSYETTNEAIVFTPPGKRAHQHFFDSIKGFESGSSEDADRPDIDRKADSDKKVDTVTQPKNP